VAVKIRLKRLGKIRSPHYRIVVADSRTKRDGRAIEEIGKYHPKNDPSVIEVDSERAQYWLSVGAQPSEAVVALLKRTGDWQKFSGDESPSGVDPQPEKKSKLDAFNVALAEAGGEPRSAAVSAARKAAAAKSEPAKREPAKSEPATIEPATSEPATSEPATSEPATSEPATSELAKKDEASVEGTPAEAQQAADAGVADAAIDPGRVSDAAIDPGRVSDAGTEA
jgi:small subunit ribosomal protein S16